MQIHAQSTSTQVDARPPYVHLGYLAATPSHFAGLFGMFIFVVAAYFLILLKLDIAGMIMTVCRGIRWLGIGRFFGVLAVLVLIAGIMLYWWI